MPRKKYSELTAGLFVIAGLVVLLGVVLWLGAADAFRAGGSVVTFYVPMCQGSMGITEGTEITVGDGRVGRITRVDAGKGDGNCYYTGHMERGCLALHSDADAEVSAPMVGQAKVVLLSFGTAAKGEASEKRPVLLRPGGLEKALRGLDELSLMVKGQLDPTAPNSLMAGVRSLTMALDSGAGKLDRIAGNVLRETDPNDANSLIRRVGTAAENLAVATGLIRHHLDTRNSDAVLAAIQRIAGNVEKQSDANRPGSIFAAIRSSARDLETTLRDARPMVESILRHLDGTAEQIETLTREDVTKLIRGLGEAKLMVLQVLDDLRDSSQEIKEVVKLNRDSIDETMDNLNAASETLKSALKDVRRNPWRVFYQPQKGELETENVYDAARAFSSGAAELDQAVSKLRALQKMELDKDPAARQTAERIRKHLDMTFEKFSEAEKQLWEEFKNRQK